MYGKFINGILNYYFESNKPLDAKLIINEIPEYNNTTQYVVFTGMIEKENGIYYNYQINDMEITETPII